MSVQSENCKNAKLRASAQCSSGGGKDQYAFQLGRTKVMVRVNITAVFLTWKTKHEGWVQDRAVAPRSFLELGKVVVVF